MYHILIKKYTNKKIPKEKMLYEESVNHGNN